MFEKAFVNAACEKALKAIAQGDRNALAVIYDNMHKLIYSVAWSVLRNHEDSEDALQNTLCEILRCAPSYKGGGARAWILAIARNQALIIIKKQKREISFEDSLNADTPASTGGAESEYIYLEALSVLNEKEREAVVLKVYCNCKHKEIAEIIGTTPAAAEKLYQRGIAKLRDYYK